MARMSSPCSLSADIELNSRKKSTKTRGKKHELPDALRIFRQEEEVGGQKKVS